MEYVKKADYDYIMNKYHDASKPYNSFERFIRHDAIFDESTGMAGEDIIEGINKQDKEISHLPHPVRKARAFEFVLKNTRIACDERDIFPAINMIDRPLDNTVLAAWEKEVFEEMIPNVEKRRALLSNNRIVTIWPDYDHSVPLWERMFEIGFKGILEQSEQAREGITDITPKQTAFFDGIKITYTAILEFLERLQKRAKEEKNLRMAKALKNIKKNPPQSFYEALLFEYIYFMLCEHIESLQVRSLSNFDRVLYKFYKSDIENGVSQAEIKRDLAYFLLQFASIDNYWGQPVYLGGCKADESTQINELSYDFLEVYDALGIYNPKIQIKIADSTPKDFILKALDMIRRGNNSMVFVNDATMRKALMNTGVSKDEARLCDVKGCYEYAIRGSYDSPSMIYLNLLKPLDFALHEGCDSVKNMSVGLKSPKAEEYKDFESFYNEYKNQLGYLISESIDISNSFEGYLDYVCPQSMHSATVPSCLEKGKDILVGGATENGSGIMFGFMANIVDSLTNIKKYVFDSKQLTLAELRDILDNDFKGNEKLRLQLLADRDKYGNNKELPDYFAKDIAEFVCSKVCGVKNTRGGTWNVGFHVARQSYVQAPLTASSPDGRLKGEELSKNLSASMGMNREGATAAILSVTKIDATKFSSDAALDLGLLPSAVKGEEGLEAMYGLLMTFVKRGGHAMHINVFDAETLRSAQKEPEKYTDLQIRVCGWNVLFNNISKEEQDGFIRQAENLV